MRAIIMPVDRAQLATGEERCGVEVCTGRFTWVCRRFVHDDGAQRSSRPSALGYWPQADRHHFVRKWPGTDR